MNRKVGQYKVLNKVFNRVLFVVLLGGILGLVACTKSTPNSTTGGAPEQSHSAAKTPVSLLEQNAAPDYQRAASVNVELGLGYLAQGQVARAKTKLMHALKLAPKMPETHSAMAYFLEMVGEIKDAEREHKKAIALSGKGAMYNNYGAFLCRQNRFKEANQAFHNAIQDKEYPRTAEVFENAGLCALKAADQDSALQYLALAVRRDPNRASALLELAALDLNQGKTKEASDLLTRYKAIAEPSARSLWLGILVAKALNDDNAVASQALLLKNLFADSPEYQSYLQSEKNHS